MNEKESDYTEGELRRKRYIREVFEVKQIARWLTTDGSEFDNVHNAKAWEQYISFAQELNILIESNLNATYGNSNQDVFNFFIEQYQQFRQLFEAYKDMIKIPKDK
ncbi:hypothetical protein LCGC14_2185390 [marine sediment metagenome]|uniref:Uncharacterized protein n=1 Tax=marine sediment metagenome TaxID=412755 RepID=A0A0F9DLA1_9ZZZZ